MLYFSPTAPLVLKATSLCDSNKHKYEKREDEWEDRRGKVKEEEFTRLCFLGKTSGIEYMNKCPMSATAGKNDKLKEHVQSNNTFVVILFFVPQFKVRDAAA